MEIYIQGIILNIGISIIYNITEDFQIIYIQIFYNSLKLIYNDNNIELGPIKNEEFMFKNISDLLSEGGEVSKISIMVIKKYDYYINNFTKKQRISNSKQDEIEQDLKENLEKFYDSKEPDNCIICFRLICIDSLVYKWMKNKNPNYQIDYINELSKIKYILDFFVKSFEIYENFEEGKIYEICLINILKKGKNFIINSIEKKLC
jgi:hypothetical protein